MILRKILATCLIGLGMLVSAASSAADKPLPMWEARSQEGTQQGTVYLFGSIHVCREQCLRFPASVLNRFRDSEALAVELDPTTPEVAERILAAAMLPGKQTVQAKLSSAQTARLQQALNKLGVSLTQVEHMHPAMVSSTITMLAAQAAGLSAEDGIDMWFLQEARKRGMPVRELETIERQLAALFSGSEREQLDSLMQDVDMVLNDRVGSYLEDMVQSWMNGDLPAIDKLMHEGAEQKSLEDALMRRRNIEMANKIATWLTRGENIFVVIGAGHLTGKDNVAELLARKGFRVRQLHDDQ